MAAYIFDVQGLIWLDVNMKKIFIASALAFGVTIFAQAKDLVDTAIGAKSFKTLITVPGAEGLIDTLKGKAAFTVFSPTQEAFNKIPKADLDSPLKDKAKLSSVLTYHVVASKVKTVQGTDVTFSTPMGVAVDNAKTTKTDIVAGSGVLHVIDTVITPQ